MSGVLGADALGQSSGAGLVFSGAAMKAHD